MNDVAQALAPAVGGGVELRGTDGVALETFRQTVMERLAALSIDGHVLAAVHEDPRGRFIRLRLDSAYAARIMPAFDTTGLCQTLGLHTTDRSDDLEREIVLAMLNAPLAFPFPSPDELFSAVRIRKNIVHAGRKTALAFDTEEAERPEEYWTYSEQRGFTVRHGKSLIEALQKATQPDRSGKLYSFSCYRATEYVMLLGIAQELAHCNPDLSGQLQHQWETRALMSTPFHDVLLHEYGTLSDPLPSRYYVPGDRLWFRNPHEPSSNVEGYEGSWVFYLGGGLFTNFWKRDQPFTLTTKCVELYHWRHAMYRDEQGLLRIDDDVVDDRVRRSFQNPAEVDAILEKMLRLREGPGIYTTGGCVDATREHARRVCPGTSDIVFPG